ncbi:MAG TPA: universal stress protein [Thermomicrobiales bacterium]|nr:universal stress protein [Thermomicrobiales bacterium]
MSTHRIDDSTLRILIPWHDDTVLDELLTFARGIGGGDAHIMLLPLASACAPEREIRLAAARGIPLEIVQPACEGPAAECDIAAIAAKRAADLILMTTTCHPAGHLDEDCLPAQVALDSPIPVLLVRTHPGERGIFPPSFTRLLIPTDGSTRSTQSLPFAARLASRLRLPVQFVMVIDPMQALPPAYAYDPGAEELIAGLREDAHWALKRGEQMLARHGIAVNSSLLYGPVVACITESVRKGDLVLLTTHGRGNAPAGRLGSVAKRMVAEIPDPMVIMRGHPAPERVAVGHLA